MVHTRQFNVIAAACENMGIGIKGDLPWRLKKEMAYFTRMTSSTTCDNKRNAVIMGRKTWESIPPKYRPMAKRFNIVISNTLKYVCSSSLCCGHKTVYTGEIICIRIDFYNIVGVSGYFHVSSDVSSHISLKNTNQMPMKIYKISSETGCEGVPVFRSLSEAVDHLSSPSCSDIEQIWIIGGSALYKEAIHSSLCDKIYLTRIAGKFECDTFFPEVPEFYERIKEDGVPDDVQEEKGISYEYTVLKNKKDEKSV